MSPLQLFPRVDDGGKIFTLPTSENCFVELNDKMGEDPIKLSENITIQGALEEGRRVRLSSQISTNVFKIKSTHTNYSCIVMCSLGRNKFRPRSSGRPTRPCPSRFSKCISVVLDRPYGDVISFDFSSFFFHTIMD